MIGFSLYSGSLLEERENQRFSAQLAWQIEILRAAM